MFEWFTSKVAMSVAVIILVAAMIGFFAFINSRVKNVEFQSIADSMASAVERTASSNENITTRVTFREGYNNGTYVPAMFDSEGYDITITASNIIIQQGSRTASAPFRENIHVWKPDSSIELTKQEVLNARDTSTPLLKFKSGKDFLIENKRLTVDLVYEYHCFVYLDA